MCDVVRVTEMWVIWAMADRCKLKKVCNRRSVWYPFISTVRPSIKHKGTPVCLLSRTASFHCSVQVALSSTQAVYCVVCGILGQVVDQEGCTADDGAVTVHCDCAVAQHDQCRRLQATEHSSSLKAHVATIRPPLKYYLQLGCNILRLHSYKVPLVKGQICTVQYLKMVRRNNPCSGFSSGELLYLGGKKKMEHVIIYSFTQKYVLVGNRKSVTFQSGTQLRAILPVV